MASDLEQFNYLMVMDSVIVGLGITTMLQGVGQLITTRSKVRHFGPYYFYDALFLLYLAEYWWGMWLWREKPLPFSVYLFGLSSPAVLFLTIQLLATEMRSAGIDKVIDLKELYFQRRKNLFRLAAFAVLLTMIESKVCLSEPTFGALNIVRAVGASLFVTASITDNISAHRFVFPFIHVAAFFTFMFLKQPLVK
jgi:hypothetical protein